MYSYESMRHKHAEKVSQSIDSPIMVFDHFELVDVFLALFVILFFGVILYSWEIMFLLLAVVLGIGPIVKKNNKKGIYLHYPYFKFGMSLPGLINPRGRRRFSD